MKIVRWSIPKHLDLSIEISGREHMAQGEKMGSTKALDVLRGITFSGSAPAIQFADVESLFSFVEKKFLHKTFAGVGIEVGAGPMIFSSLLTRSRPNIQQMYGIELSGGIVEFIAPGVVDELLGPKSEKVVGVIGSFDAMELTSESVDFVLDFMSLHHATDLGEAFAECYRVLKPGGFVVLFDKARPDSFTSQDLEGLLNTEYSDEEKKRFGVPSGEHFTRRMNGEKEYRLKDWSAGALEAGFPTLMHWRLARTNVPGISGLYRRLLSHVPLRTQMATTAIAQSVLGSGSRVKFSQKNLVYSRYVNPFPREISLMIAHKAY